MTRDTRVFGMMDSLERLRDEVREHEELAEREREVLKTQVRVYKRLEFQLQGWIGAAHDDALAVEVYQQELEDTVRGREAAERELSEVGLLLALSKPVKPVPDQVCKLPEDVGQFKSGPVGTPKSWAGRAVGARDPEVDQILGEVGMFDAEQFEELLAGLTEIAGRVQRYVPTAELDPAWARACEYLKLARLAVGQRRGN